MRARSQQEHRGEWEGLALHSDSWPSLTPLEFPPLLLCCAQVGFLKRLEAIAETGETQADSLLHLYNTKWGKSVDPLFTEYRY